MHPTSTGEADLWAELRRSELVIEAVTGQVESVITLVRTTAHDPHWRGPAARAFARAVEHRLDGLHRARRSLDQAQGALAAAHRAAQWSAESVAQATLTGLSRV
jgi:hypothetical protein